MEQEARLQEQVILGLPSAVRERAALQDYEAVCCFAERKEVFREVAEGLTRRTLLGEASLSKTRRHASSTLLESAPSALGEPEGEATRAFVVLRKDFETIQNLIRHVHLEHGPVATLAEVTLVDRLRRGAANS